MPLRTISDLKHDLCFKATSQSKTNLRESQLGGIVVCLCSWHGHRMLRNQIHRQCPNREFFTTVFIIPVAAGEEQGEKCFNASSWTVMFSSLWKSTLCMLLSKDAEIKALFLEEGQFLISTYVFYLKGTMKHHYLPLQKSWRNSQATYPRGLKMWFQLTLIKPLSKRFVMRIIILLDD